MRLIVVPCLPITKRVRFRGTSILRSSLRFSGRKGCRDSPTRNAARRQAGSEPEILTASSGWSEMFRGIEILAWLCSSMLRMPTPCLPMSPDTREAATTSCNSMFSLGRASGAISASRCSRLGPPVGPLIELDRLRCRLPPEVGVVVRRSPGEGGRPVPAAGVVCGEGGAFCCCGWKLGCRWPCTAGGGSACSDDGGGCCCC